MAEKNTGNRRGLGGLFYRNTFLLIFSFVVSLIIWFVMKAQTTDSNKMVYDVPITVQLSDSAAEDGVQVFRQSYTEADLEISGNSLITNRLTGDDFAVTAFLNPASTKLTGNTMQKATIQVRASKRTSISDYNIVSVNPEEITVEYDRYKESAFPIEQELTYSADTGYYTGTPALSAESVTVRGPESSVNKISRAAVNYTFTSPLRADASFTCPVRLYDQNNQEITDLVGLCLELDVDTLEVEIPILSRKTVNIVATILHQPKGVADSRITVDPAQIDIVGSAEALSSIQEITLDTPIDFATLDTAQRNVFTMDIPLPAGVRNISTVGENSVSQATVSVNLNDFKKVVVSVPAANFQVSNRPAGKEVSFNTQLLEVTVIGSEAQANKLTGDSLSVQLDLQNFASQLGSIEVPATISFTGAGSDSCWALGQYTVSLQLSEQTVSQANAPVSQENESDAVAASPNE